MYASINHIPLAQGLRDLARGKIPQKPAGDSSGGGSAQWVKDLGPKSGTTAGGIIEQNSERGNALANAARRYLGVPYRWGGSDPKTGLDCSGLVQVSFRDVGVNDCPRTSFLIAAWSKLYKVTREQARAGDILYWTGHVAVATSNTTMVEAPTFGIPVREVPIRSGPLCLRYKW